MLPGPGIRPRKQDGPTTDPLRERYLTASFRALPALNFGALDGPT